MKNSKQPILALFFGIAILAGVAMAQTNTRKIVLNTCDQFKTPVIKPQATSDPKMPVIKPDETADYKGIEINPCEQSFWVKTIPPPEKKEQGKANSVINKVLAPDGTVKPLTSILNTAEIMKKARAAIAAKKAN